MSLDKLALQGKHNIYNSMAASVASKLLDIRKDVIKESLSDFKNVEHRLEYVARIHGVDYINDSKATNTNSSWYALETVQLIEKSTINENKDIFYTKNIFGIELQIFEYENKENKENNGIIWIAGGIDKGNDYSLLQSLVNEKVKAIICLGQNNSNLIDSFNGLVKNIYEVKSMEEAVELSKYISIINDVVLLSPACASFDLFENYEERGNLFKKIVSEL